MRFFATLSVLATIACAGFTSAAPTSDPVSGVISKIGAGQALKLGNAMPANIVPGHAARDGVVNVLNKVDTAVVAPVKVEVEHNKVLSQRTDPRSLPVVLIDTAAQLTPYCQKLTEINTATCSEGVLTPILQDITVILTAAIAEVKLLIGLPLEVVLACAGRVLTLNEIAKIVAALICLIFHALWAVAKIVASTQYHVIIPLLCNVGVVVCDLLVVVFGLVGGLLEVVLPLIEEIVPCILLLKVTPLIALLKLHN